MSVKYMFFDIIIFCSKAHIQYKTHRNSEVMFSAFLKKITDLFRKDLPHSSEQIAVTQGCMIQLIFVKI